MFLTNAKQFVFLWMRIKMAHPLPRELGHCRPPFCTHRFISLLRRCIVIIYYNSSIIIIIIIISYYYYIFIIIFSTTCHYYYNNLN